MRRLQRTLLLLLLASLALTGLGFNTRTTAAPAAPQAFPDDEIAYINFNTCAQITDPVPQPGQAPFTWVSPTCGYTDIAPSDVNADGINELIAIGGNTARLLVPFTPAGTTPAFLNLLPSGFVYISAGAGDIVAGDNGRSELVLQKTDPRSGYAVEIWQSGNSAGTLWNRIYDEPFGAPWIRIGIGQYNGLAADEVIMVRNGTAQNNDRRVRILTHDFGIFQVLAERTYGFDWLELAVGNVNNNNGELVELVLSRSQVGGTLPSYLVFQYTPSNPIADAPGGQGTYVPYWQTIALGNVNGAGADKEVFMIRDPQTDNGVSMIGINYGSDIPWNTLWPNPGLQLGRSLKSVAAGDVDGDGKDEIMVAQPSSYRIYLEPDVSFVTSGELPASFRDPVIMRPGNYDGSGLQPAQLSVDQTLLSFEMLRGGANPANKTFAVTNSGGGGAISYDVSKQSGQAWVNVTPFEGTTPGTQTVSINGAGLTPGTYEETINVTAKTSGISGSPQKVTVRLRVIATGPELKVEPASMTFSQNFGGVTPAAQTLSIQNIGDGGAQHYQLTISTTDGGAWLQTNKTNGNTNDTVAVSINSASLRPGTYTGKIRVNAGAITGSPVDVPVTLTIIATGMVVTPSSLLLRADVGLPSPRLVVNVDQSVAGQGAIHWYAYAVSSGDWWGLQQAAAGKALQVERQGEGLVVTTPGGGQTTLDTLPWVILTPDNGLTPGVIQVTLNMDLAPVGESHVTILVDGGPGTPSRFQGVDVLVEVNNGGAYLPLMLR